MDYSELTPMQMDALKEVSNIGAGNGATALSQLLNRKIDMTVPSVNVIPLESVFTKIDAEKIAVGVIVRVMGDTPGNILFIFEEDVAFDIIKRLTGSEEDELSEMGISVLSEIGNIISASYMNAIARFTKLNITPSVPAVSCDMVAAILSTSFIEAGQFDDNVLDFETEFLEDNSNTMSGHFYYIPMPGSLEKILKTLGVN